jgi:hypothetical protein
MYHVVFFFFFLQSVHFSEKRLTVVLVHSRTFHRDLIIVVYLSPSQTRCGCCSFQCKRFAVKTADVDCRSRETAQVASFDSLFPPLIRFRPVRHLQTNDGHTGWWKPIYSQLQIASKRATDSRLFFSDEGKQIWCTCWKRGPSPSVDMEMSQPFFFYYLKRNKNTGGFKF